LAFAFAPVASIPQAADSVGINVYRMRYYGVFISGWLGGIGGLAYTVAAGSTFPSSVAGYGFLALAVMIFVTGNPGIFGCFPLLCAVQDHWQLLEQYSVLGRNSTN
jgi:ABC-type uncharacterized transport system permease subunit